MKFVHNHTVKISAPGTPYDGKIGRVVDESIAGDVVVELQDKGHECVHFQEDQLTLQLPAGQEPGASVAGNAGTAAKGGA
jgi:hypothetical protein